VPYLAGVHRTCCTHESGCLHFVCCQTCMHEVNWSSWSSVTWVPWLLGIDCLLRHREISMHYWELTALTVRG
jgi:hypothetical protein